MSATSVATSAAPAIRARTASRFPSLQPTRRRWYQPNATVIAVGVVGLIVGVIVGIESLKRPAPAPMGDGDVAVVMCQSFIENRLEAPSTAVFSDVVYSGGPPRWTVTGVVDAKSAAGYPLRSVFRCVVIDNTDNGSGIWHLEYLTGDDATTSPIWDEVVTDLG